MTSQLLFEMLSIGQPGVDALRVVIGESIAREETARDIEGVKITARDLVVGPDSRVFEVVWTRIARYAITLESYALPEDGKLIGNHEFICEFQDSRFLRHVREETFGEAVWGPMRHWGLYCLNHCIDVAGWREPVVRELFDFHPSAHLGPGSEH